MSPRTRTARLAMGLIAARFGSLLFTALSPAPALAHLLALPNKLGASRDAYFTMQQVYRGWALLGIVVVVALLSTLALAVKVRKQRRAFLLTGLAFLCLVGAQFVFRAHTFPANQQTSNWTEVPQHWTVLRTQWEFSHAAGAGFNLVALVALAASVAAPDKRVPSGPRTA